ncbi:multicopper oxidase family protein [Clostridium tertium]|uniref:multicopper oxidase family protein n=1 Tax=Clostridium tertium TaxID=1559 RepID=UPI0024B3C567|nr:multicopper oxidase domain-containing protein [Clostridium tertium]MDI9218774.1 multicopper oxidase domain-containing protein [Clostridium tertium]
MKSKNSKYIIIGVIALAIIIAYALLMNPFNESLINNTDREEKTNITNNTNNDNNIDESKNKLPIPELLEDTNPDENIAEFTLEPQEGKTSFIDNKQTNTMGYNGSFLGPVIRVNKGEKVNIHVNNKLKEATTIHWHGLEVEGKNDGGPHQGIQSGETWSPSFTINQPAATLWYHPHFIGSTATQVYKGLAGLFYIEDEVSKSLNIPKDYGINDIPLVIQDRSFNKDGSFIYDPNMMDGAVGDTIIINGSINPTLDVKTEKVRFRIVNGANSSNFDLKLSNNDEFYQIASDGGFLEAPVKQNSIFLSPGERGEIIVDFSKYEVGTKIELKSDNKSIMTFNVNEKVEDKTEIPNSLTTINRMTKDTVTKERSFELRGMGHMVSINNEKFDMDIINEVGKYGETEIWTITNPATMMHSMGHPFHIHGTQFQILTRNGKEPLPEEMGWKDTVFINPDEEVKLIVRFNNVGAYMYHCHILEHEEEGMMGQIKIE